MNRDNLLMVADSERDANMLYAVRMFLPDAFIYLRLRGRCHVVVSDLEVDRTRSQASHCRVLSLTQCRKAIDRNGGRKTGLPQVIRELLRQKRLRKIFV